MAVQVDLRADVVSRLLVVGTGRCGTRYASHVLRAAGVECGHEQVYTFRTALGIRQPCWAPFTADSSWLAVPSLPVAEARTILLVRHPLDVVHSMLQLGWFADDQRKDVAKVIYQHRPQIRTEATCADKALAMWMHWNTCALPYAHAVVRFEDMIHDPAALLVPAGVEGRPSPEAVAEIAADPRRVNTKDDKKVPTPRPTWDDFRPALARAALGVAGMFGYREGRNFDVAFVKG